MNFCPIFLLFDPSLSHFADFFFLRLLLLLQHRTNCELQFTYVIRYVLKGCFLLFIWSDDFSYSLIIYLKIVYNDNDIIIIIETTSKFVIRHQKKNDNNKETVFVRFGEIVKLFFFLQFNNFWVSIWHVTITNRYCFTPKINFFHFKIVFLFFVPDSIYFKWSYLKMYRVWWKTVSNRFHFIEKKNVKWTFFLKCLKSFRINCVSSASNTHFYC